MSQVPHGPGRRLVHIAVSGLLDAFHHSVSFPEEWDFVILYGPNGVGKTKLLELVRAAIGMDFEPLRLVPFQRLTLSFSDESELTIERSVSSGQKNSPDIIVTLLSPSGAFSYDLSADPFSAAASWLMNSTTWRPHEGRNWMDSSDGEVDDIRSLVERYDAPTPIRNRMRAVGESDSGGAPQELVEFCKSVPIHLIETQRLLALERYDDSVRYARLGAATRYRDRLSPSWSRTVTQYSDHLRTQLSEALANNSRLGQQLDRTFPRRIMQGSVPSGVDDDSIRLKYETQNKLRSRLSRFGLIEAEGDLPLPEQRLSDFEVKALSIYLNDTDQKLASFQALLERLELFVSLINQRLARKTVAIDVNEGLTIHRNDTGERIGAEALSSGEQHELVLVYDLLFRTPPRSTVLIDEPEISLHVAWQLKFLSDIAAIAQLSDLRFVIATHSPQIIDTWWDRTSPLDLG